MIHVGIDILPIAFDDVFTSTRQSKSISFGSETGNEKTSEEQLLSKFLCSYLSTHVLILHACPLSARVFYSRTLSHFRRPIPLPQGVFRSKMRIQLPYAYPASTRIFRSRMRIPLMPAYRAFLHACPSYAGVSHSRTPVLLLILDHISVPN